MQPPNKAPQDNLKAMLPPPLVWLGDIARKAAVTTMMEINHKEQQQEKITTEACLIHAYLSSVGSDQDTSSRLVESITRREKGRAVITLHTHR